MVGSAVVRHLQSQGHVDILTASRAELDLCRQDQTEAFFSAEKPEVVIFAAARVGGILANSTRPADFLYENLAMASNAIHAAYRSGTNRFLFLGSTCIYPRNAPQPIQESALLTSELEMTNEAYAVAKIAGLKMCQHYRSQHGVIYHSIMPTNLYGPGDNYHSQHSHVLPALIRRFHEAKAAGDRVVSIWGTGTPLREFLHVDDLASGILHLLSLSDPPDVVNIGSGEEVSILQLAKMIADAVGYQGEITTDPTKPDGTPRKLADSSMLRASGWSPRIPLLDGIPTAYSDFLSSVNDQSLRTV